VRSSYEMFVLTPRYGPQMIFFSLLHTWPSKAITLFFYSWYAYYPFIVFMAAFALLRAAVGFTPVGRWAADVRSSAHASRASRRVAGVVSRLAGPSGRLWSAIIYTSAILAMAHFAAAMTYDTWSEALFHERV
jgi:hypothetical protein